MARGSSVSLRFPSHLAIYVLLAISLSAFCAAQLDDGAAAFPAEPRRLGDPKLPLALAAVEALLRQAQFDVAVGEYDRAARRLFSPVAEVSIPGRPLQRLETLEEKAAFLESLAPVPPPSPSPSANGTLLSRLSPVVAASLIERAELYVPKYDRYLGYSLLTFGRLLQEDAEQSTQQISLAKPLPSLSEPERSLSEPLADPHPADLKLQIQEAWANFSLNLATADVAAAASIFADNVTLLPPGHPKVNLPGPLDKQEYLQRLVDCHVALDVTVDTLLLVKLKSSLTPVVPTPPPTPEALPFQDASSAMLRGYSAADLLGDDKELSKHMRAGSVLQKWARVNLPDSTLAAPGAPLAASRHRWYFEWAIWNYHKIPAAHVAAM
ncbi:unnamed protein product [Closterium sp. Naga37s-1]|nr:unnamed protein product [Closterium sp. Naga37s-1]